MNTVPRILIFYAGMLHSEVHVFPRLEELGAEVYNGAHVYVHSHWLPHSIWETVGWYRADKTPVLEADVPKELRVLTLLLT